MMLYEVQLQGNEAKGLFIWSRNWLSHETRSDQRGKNP
jgi:hypothetical protein